MKKELSEETRAFFAAAGKRGQQSFREKVGEEAYRASKKKAQKQAMKKNMWGMYLIQLNNNQFL